MPNTRVPDWYGPTNWGTGAESFPSKPTTVPPGKLSYEDWWNQIGSQRAYSRSFGSPAASYLEYIGYDPSTGQIPTIAPSPGGPIPTSEPTVPSPVPKRGTTSNQPTPTTPMGQYGGLSVLNKYSDPMGQMLPQMNTDPWQYWWQLAQTGWGKPQKKSLDFSYWYT